MYTQALNIDVYNRTFNSHHVRSLESCYEAEGGLEEGHPLDLYC